jgi:tRNA dimethylallyltransferase
LSLRLAEAIGGAEIVSADSRQVYRGMDIGTAKVSAADRARVAHHGLDLVDPDEPFSAADYQRAADHALRAIAARSHTAILVGGTGLYLRAVARGFPLADTGHDPVTRSELDERLASEGLPALVKELRRTAPAVAAATDLANPRRVIRALERARVQGDRLPPVPKGYPAPSVWIGLQVEPSIHRRWIADRARGQFAGGLIEEAKRLRDRYGEGPRAFSAVGYREAFEYLDGNLTLEQAVERNIVRNNQFARRQRTWFRAEPNINWLDAASPSLQRDVLEIIKARL